MLAVWTNLVIIARSLGGHSPESVLHFGALSRSLIIYPLSR